MQPIWVPTYFLESTWKAVLVNPKESVWTLSHPQKTSVASHSGMESTGLGHCFLEGVLGSIFPMSYFVKEGH